MRKSRGARKTDSYLWIFSMTSGMLSCISVFCIPEIINRMLGNHAAAPWRAAFALPIAGLIFLCLAAFLRTKFKAGNTTYIKALGRMLALLLILGCWILVLSLLCGLMAVLVYALERDRLTLSQIKGLINVLATGIHLAPLPFFISVFWSEAAGDRGFWASMAWGLRHGWKNYLRLFLTGLGAFGGGFLVLSAFYDMPQTLGVRLGQGVLLGGIGAAALARSGQICLKLGGEKP